MNQKSHTMTNAKQSKKLINEQLQTFLNVEHIRQHLIKVGLISQLGEVIPKEEYERTHKHRSRRRQISNKNVENKQRCQTALRRPMENTKNRRSKSPDFYSTDRRRKSASIVQSKHTNKTQSPTRLKSPLVHRAVSPKIIPANDRCLVTIIYHGPQISINYERNWFQPRGDEIFVTQQHCGGENLIVFKGPLKPNETFQFESRRHPDYPFALAFYVNGCIDNRLSICCEYRYKHNVRIGGKRGLFGIKNVQNSKACRRCRIEQRMKRLAELKAKNTATSSPEPTTRRTMSSEERYESPPCSPIDVSNQQLRMTNSPNNFDVPEEKIHSSISTPYENEISISEKNPTNQRRISIVSFAKDNDDEITTATDQSNTDFEEA